MPPRPTGPKHFRHKGSDLLAIHPEAMSVTYEPRELETVAEVIDGIAVLCIDTPLQHKGGGWWWCYFDSYESILGRFRMCLESDEVQAILLKIDSPGGDAAGLNETVDAMVALKKKIGKPVYAYADESAYSAAYAIACVADEIYLPESGGLGSIGVVAQIADWTEMNKEMGLRVEVVTSGARKADGNPNVPITDEALAHVQRRVDQLAGLFWGLVSTSRGMSEKKIQKLEADTFFGSDAVAKGLADDVGSLGDVMSMIRERLAQPGSISVRSTLSKPSATTDGEPTEESTMGILAAARAVTDAETALAAAKTTAQKAAASKVLAAAKAEFATYESKYRKTKETKETETKDDDEDEKEKEEEKEEEEKEEEKEEGGDEESSVASTGSTSAEKEQNQAFLSASTGLYTNDRLFRLCQQITGKSDVREVFGALDALGARAKSGDKAMARIEALEKKDRVSEVSTLLASARSAGKITKSMQKELEAKGLEDPKWLKGYLATLPNIVEHDASRGKVEVGGAQVTEEQMRIWKKMGMTDAQIEVAAKQFSETEEKRQKTMTTKGAN